MRILVTGGVGYLGGQICDLLHKEGHTVVVFDNLLWKQGSQIAQLVVKGKINWLYLEDVTKWSDRLKREIELADVIIPLAAYVGAPLCDKFPEESIKLNEEWPKQLLNYVKDQWVIFPNTNSSYGSYPGICTEETPTKPLSLYAKTKQNAETALRSYDNFIGFRLATVFGYSYRMRTDLLINNLVYQKHVDLFDPHFMRNYIHVKDIARAVQFAIDNRKRMGTQIYNLGNDSINMSKLDLMKNITQITKATYKIDRTKSDPDKRDYTVSSQKLYNLGYKPSYSLEYGIQELKTLYKLYTEEDFKRSRNY